MDIPTINTHDNGVAEKEFKPSGLFEYILTYHRGLFSTIFLLPMSVVYNSFQSLRNRLTFLMHSAPVKHAERVKEVQQQIKQWAAENSTQKLCTARSGWLTMSDQVPAYKQTDRNIRIAMYDVLNVDIQRQTIYVEPMVNIGQITAILNPMGYTLPVVPELEDLTVGGLINGFGVETSSHKYGLFQYIIESIDMVTADGELMHCSKTENCELFYMVPWSHGTLGFLVAAELRIIPAKKYVKLFYQPVYSQGELAEVFERESRDTAKNDFVEALVYGENEAVVMTGTFADKTGKDIPVNKIGNYWKPWFYKHVQTYLTKKQTGYEYIPLRHYYHRHTRSYFWEMNEIIPFGNHPLFRYTLGWALPPKISLLKYCQTETTERLRSKYHIVQDMLMPVTQLQESLQYFHDEFNVYPLWMAPMAIFDNEQHLGFVHPYSLPGGGSDSMFVDIGAYGSPLKRPFDARIALRELEKFVLSHHGYQALYAKTLMSREELHEMFDHSYYHLLRSHLPLCTRAFNEVYDKVSSRGRVSPTEARKLHKVNG